MKVAKTAEDSIHEMDCFFSIVLPLYNKKAYIKRAIQSVIKQTFQSWELIIIDDGSTDGSADEIFESSRVRVYKQDNCGVSMARNRALKLSRGKYVLFLDADDYYLPDKLQHEFDALDLHPDIDLTLGAGYFEPQPGTLKSYDILHKDGSPYQNGSRITEKFLHEYRIEDIPINGHCVSRKLCEQTQGFSLDLAFGEITEFRLRCILESKLVMIHSTPLYVVTNVPGSASKQTENILNAKRVLGETLFDLAKKYPDHVSYLRQKAEHHSLSYALSLSLLGRNSEAKRFIKQAPPIGKLKKLLAGLILWITPLSVLKRMYRQSFRNLSGGDIN